MENVDQILNGVNIKDFKRWIGELAGMGYTSAYSVLNAKDFEVPQSRSRCFMVSMTKGRRYSFPEPCPDGRIMADILEDRPDEGLYLSEKEISTYERHREAQEEQGHGFGWPPSESVGYAHALTTKPDRASQSFIIVCGDLNSPHRIDQTNRVHSDRGLSPCVCANVRKSGGPLIEDVRSGKIRIRCLTPLECWRLQGFPDTAFRKAKEAGVSNSQLYRQAGNSIAVPCLKAIFKGIYIDHRWVGAPSLEAFA